MLCSVMAGPAHSPIHSVRVLVLLHLLQSTSTICSKRDSVLQGPALSMEATCHQSSLWPILCLLPSLWEAETLFVSFLAVFDIQSLHGRAVKMTLKFMVCDPGM